MQPDPDIIQAVLAGDGGQFAILVQRHNQAVFRACRAVVDDDAEAEDAVQVAWVNAYKSLASFRGDAAFRTWITTIAVREASSRLRKRRRIEALPVEAIPRSDANSPERDAFNLEIRHMLEQHLDALPEGMRDVIVLRDVLELDTAETAACLGIAGDAVRVRLHRARQALASRLADRELRELPSVWRFDGERCARVQAAVMRAVLG